ncbi:hypothetical protein P168DRAFT_290835 [Aspergillus campestris IBT 28561]|uniref:MHYT domain-containing protein n=1 Tax=Aspergillus campestris (strain IBT 28561) TaxID=1392248 RepID=A0A2I1D1C6_ASPC2|nr:uncharacterized protein P168DRAFT_290835 [Aspergillus campestris IBT 28561]PKY03683.1 hypothetical protein P168DRAFT_290835 [Aspergillus campestris IBT 28561]
MGGVGIWSMHFIGNRAIILGNGDSHIQISYSVPYTGLSFVCPVLILFTAFYAGGASEKAGYLRIISGGALTGAAVFGMHYIGQMGISNYNLDYHVGNFFGSFVIAILASTVALGIFFRWKATWVGCWWRRVLCGVFLAGAVSGMHWTATVGTLYRDYDKTVKPKGQVSRSQTAIICFVFSLIACGVLTGCAIVAGGNRRRLRTQAQQVTLTCAFFDHAGRIMVTPHALLPSRKVVDRYVGKTFNDDDLTRTHSAFLWAFRASRNWALVKDSVPFMRSRIESDETLMEHYISKGMASAQDTEMQPDFDGLFKRHFCVAAQDLADEVRQPLQDLGMLYDDVLATTTPHSHLSRMMGYSRLHTSKGQVMFTVRKLTKQEASRLAGSGFRFTTIENVTGVLSRRIHVPSTTLGLHLKDMRDFAATSRAFEPGIHLVSFVLRPTVRDRFQVLTAKGTGNPLPSSTLQIKRLDTQHLALLARMEGWTMTACLSWLKSDRARFYKDVDDFPSQLIQAISSLNASLPTNVNSVSKFSSRPLIAPCRGLRDSNSTKTCTLLSFCTVASLDTRVSNPNLIFTPLRLFRVQQQVNDGVPDSDDFTKELGQDLFYSTIRSNFEALTPSSPSSSSSPSPSPSPSALRFWSKKKKQPRNSKQLRIEPKLLSRGSSVSTEPPLTPLGDIMVRREIKVDIARPPEPAADPEQEPQILETTVVAGRLACSNYVDELYNLCYSPGVRQRPDSGLQHVPTS